MERTWTGRIAEGRQADHERFVDWLGSTDGLAHLSRALLSGYRVAEQDGRVTVSFGASEPPPLIRFLRNRRFWPEFWEFESASPDAAVGPSARQLVAWSPERADG